MSFDISQYLDEVARHSFENYQNNQTNLEYELHLKPRSSRELSDTFFSFWEYIYRYIKALLKK